MAAYRIRYADKAAQDFNDPELILFPAAYWVEGMPEADKQWAANAGSVKAAWLQNNKGRPKPMMSAKPKRPTHPDADIEKHLKEQFPDTGLLGRMMKTFGGS